MHSRSLWLGPTMSSCNLAVPTRELDSLEESLQVCLCSCSPLMGEGWLSFFCVSGVVTNARSAHSVGALVEELTCTVKKPALRLTSSHRRKWRRRALFSSVYAWERQYSYIFGRTHLLWYDWLRFPRECDSTRCDAHRLEKNLYLALP